MSENTGLASSDTSAGDDILATQQHSLRTDIKSLRQDAQTAGATINGATLPVPCYFYNTDDEWYACDANVNTKLEFNGFAITNGTDGNSIVIQFHGVVGGFTGLTKGAKYYVQDAVGTIGTSMGTYEVLVGVAISTTEILIEKGHDEYMGSDTGNGSNAGSDATSNVTAPTGWKKAVIKFVYDPDSGVTNDFAGDCTVYKKGKTSATFTVNWVSGTTSITSTSFSVSVSGDTVSFTSTRLGNTATHTATVYFYR